MKKKQLLATLIMLSLMQGSTYAADKITEADLTAGGTNELRGDVGPIYIIGNKEKDYTINVKDGLNITDVEHRGIIVSTENSNDNAKISSLTINGTVNIGSNNSQQIKLSKEYLGDESYRRNHTALIQVGEAPHRGNGGSLTINGDLNIENIDFSDVNALISVGSYDDQDNNSVFNAGNINIDNVAGGKNAIIYLNGWNSEHKTEFSANDIIVKNSSAGTLIDSSDAKPVTVNSILMENVNFTGSAIETDNFYATGNITFKGTNNQSPATFGDEYLFYFKPNKDDVIDIAGGIDIENVKGTYDGNSTSSAFSFNSNGNNGGSILLPYININNLEMVYDGRLDMYAVQFTNGGRFEICDIEATNITFSGKGNFNRGAAVTIASTETNKKINSIYVENVTTNAITSTQDFSGIILENTKMPEGISSINAINISADNVKTYGLFVNEQDLKSEYVNIEKISSKNKNAYGVRLTKGYDSTDEGFDFETMCIGDVKSENGIAIGLYATNGSDVDIKTLQVEKVQSDNKFAAAVNMSGSNLSVDNAYINLPDNEDNYGDYNGYYDGAASGETAKVNNIALRSVKGADLNWNNADGTYLVYGTVIAGSGAKNSINGGNITINGKTTQIYGDVFAGNGGKIDITLGGAGSVLEGQIDDYHELADSKLGDTFHNSSFVDNDGNALHVTSAGEAKLNINDGAKWIARGQSFLKDLTNNGIVDMTKNANSSITVSNLSGSGTFKMLLNAENKSNSDMLYVTDSISGTQNIEVDWANAEGVEALQPGERLRFATTNGTSARLNARATDTGFFNVTYLTETDDYDKDAEKNENEIYNGTGDGQGDYKPGNDFADETFDGTGTNHYIVGIDESQSEVSDAGKTIINMSRANYSNAIYMDRLNKRMGEARYLNSEDEQGMWVRLRHDRIGKDEQFRSQNTMYEIGYDVKQPVDSGDHRIGMAIDYMDGKTSYSGIAGDGDIKRYGLWLYDTWLGEKGHYTDFVAKWGHLENDFEIYNSLGKVNGDYSNNVFSVSAEYGKKNDMGSGWYFEPQVQAQLARVTGADYVTSQNTKVSLDGINSLIGRAGFRIGRDMDENSTVYLKADLLHEFLGDQTITALDSTTNGAYRETFENEGTWYDVGFGFATALGKDSYAFMDFEKSFGNDNDETYQINAGVQWTF